MEKEVQEMLAELKAMKESMAASAIQPQAQATQPQAGGVFSAWQQAAPQIIPAIAPEKVLIQCEIGVRTAQKAGNVNVFLQFPGKIAEEPQVLLGFVEGLISANVPVKVWEVQKKSSDWKR